MTIVLRRNFVAGLTACVVNAVPEPGRCTTGIGQLPAPAEDAGCTERTFGPHVVLGAGWYKFNFFGTDPSEIEIQQGPEGVTIAGGGNSYNAQLCTARKVGHGWQGMAFGGGGYFEATLSWRGPYKGYGLGGSGWPSWWSNDVEHMGAKSDGKDSLEPAVVSRRGIEVDFMEFWSDQTWGSALHEWYDEGRDKHVSSGRRTQLPPGVNASDAHRYGFLWIPATTQSPGRAQFYFDRTHIPGADVSWNLYFPSLTSPPQKGSTAFSVLDTRHLALILGSSRDNPMTVYSVEVWQRSSSGNVAMP